MLLINITNLAEFLGGQKNSNAPLEPNVGFKWNPKLKTEDKSILDFKCLFSIMVKKLLERKC